MLLGAFVTALWGLSCPGNHKSKSKSLVNTSMYESKFPKLQPWVSCFTGECDVMVNELAPDNQQHRYCVVMEAFVLQNITRNLISVKTSTRKKLDKTSLTL